MSDQQPDRRKLTLRRFFGLDRSGPPPPETLAGAPLRPLTIPNAIGLLRLLLIPVFLIVAWEAGGVAPLSAAIYAVIAWGDYIDGIAARVTGQYSRLGAILDPAIDRLLVIAGIVVCWHFDLIPWPLLAVLIARELLMLIAGTYVLRRGVKLEINWWGRWGVWPAMSGLFLGLCGARLAATLMLAAGVVLLLVASFEYGRSAVAQLRSRTTLT